MRDVVSKMTKDEYSTLDWVLHNDGAVPADRFFDDPTVDGRIEQLGRYDFVTLDDAGLHITELGRAALVEYQLLQKERFHSLCWEVVRFIIPVVISIISLVLSLLSYFSK